jgi:hypothetical protein
LALSYSSIALLTVSYRDEQESEKKERNRKEETEKTGKRNIMAHQAN